MSEQDMKHAILKSFCLVGFSTWAGGKVVLVSAGGILGETGCSRVCTAKLAEPTDAEWGGRDASCLQLRATVQPAHTHIVKKKPARTHGALNLLFHL